MVALYDQDSTLTAYSITAKDGMFHLQTRKKGELLLSVSHINYITAQISIVLPHSDTLFIVIQPKTETLEGAVATAEKPVIQMLDDGNLSFNVRQLPGSAGTDMAKVINRLPGATANSNDGLTLDGQTAVLYIDGRKVNMSDNSQALAILTAMPSESIEDIELQSYTGAKRRGFRWPDNQY